MCTISELTAHVHTAHSLGKWEQLHLFNIILICTNSCVHIRSFCSHLFADVAADPLPYLRLLYSLLWSVSIVGHFETLESQSSISLTYHKFLASRIHEDSDPMAYDRAQYRLRTASLPRQGEKGTPKHIGIYAHSLHEIVRLYSHALRKSTKLDPTIAELIAPASTGLLCMPVLC